MLLLMLSSKLSQMEKQHGLEESELRMEKMFGNGQMGQLGDIQIGKVENPMIVVAMKTML